MRSIFIEGCKSYIVFGALVFASSTYAQNHFWSEELGATATLTGGAVVAGIRDNSALFYNPGVMGFIDNPKISLSANIYGIEIVKLQNVAGNNINAQSTRTEFFPQFAGGSFNIKRAPKLKIFYGVFIKNRSSVRYNVLHEMLYDVIKGSPGNESYKGRLEYDQTATETWGGVGFGYKLNKNFSVGASMFGSYLNLESRTGLNINADALFIDSNNRISPYTATSNEATTVRLDHVSLIWKVGVGYDSKHWKLGLCATLPSASIFGNGSLSKTIEGYNLNIYSPDTTNVFAHPSFLASDEQSRLRVTYKTPPSIALGATYLNKRVKIDFTAEYFFELDYYNVLLGADKAYIQPAAAYGGQPIQNFLQIQTRSAQVLNAGLGLTVKVAPKVKLLAGVRTDFNNRMNFQPFLTGIGANSLTTSYWHLIHNSIGVAIHRGANDITLGVNYAFGIAADRNQAINFTEPIQNLWLRGKTNASMRTEVNSFSFVIGYTYFFRGSPRSSEAVTTPIQEW